MCMVKAENISYQIKNKVLLHPTSIEFGDGRFHVIMGANGAGKTTLLKLLAGSESPDKGDVKLIQKSLDSFTPKELARTRAVLSQHYQLAFPIRVMDMIMMGRFPYFNNTPRPIDLSICQELLEQLSIIDLAERDYNTLSGGEAQKVQMCRVLAQIWDANESDNKILFLDEPVSHLDVKYQYELLEIAKQYCNKHVTVIAILHDVNLALSYADRIIFIKKGKLAYDIQDLSLLTSQIIDDVFDVSSKIIYPANHKPVVIF